MRGAFKSNYGFRIRKGLPALITLGKEPLPIPGWMRDRLFLSRIYITYIIDIFVISVIFVIDQSLVP